LAKYNFYENNRNLAFISSFCLIAGFSPYLVNFDRVIELDWAYFSSLSLVVRSIVLEGRDFPLRDPWVAGGLDLLANPQTRIFSPNVILDIFLNPYFANLMSLILGGFFGMWGMFRLARLLGAEKITALLCAIVFINSSWFGNHFAEGHIPFNSFQQIPWLIYLLLRPHASRTIPLVGLLLSVWLLDGGVYAFIFSSMLIVVMSLLGLVNLKSLVVPTKSFTTAVGILSLSIFAFMLLVSTKIVPVLGLHLWRVPQQEFVAMSLKDVVVSFFYPAQSPLFVLSKLLPWRMHEYGCYLGSLTIVLAWGLTSRVLDKRSFKFLLGCIFFIWLGSGWGGYLNPWQIFMRIPIINNAHVQSRLFLFAYIFLILSIIGVLNRVFQTRPRLFGVLFLFTIMEFTFVKAYPAYSVFRGASRPDPRVSLIPYEGITATVGFAKKPDHYFDGRKSSVFTYEPAAMPTAVVPNDSNAYKGEAWVEKGSGTVSIVRHTPSRIIVSYDLQKKSSVMFNTNFLLGWDSNLNNVGVRSSQGGLLMAEIPPGQGVIELSYSPWYFQFIIVAFIIGVLFWGWLLLFRERKITKGAYDYSQIPVDYYDRVFYSGPPVQRAWHVQKFDRVLDCLPKSQGQSILDIGCFSGTFLSTLDRATFSTQIGVDILESQVSYARERYGAEFRKFYLVPDISNLQDTLPEAKNKLDLLTSIEVIEHLPEDVIHKLFDQAAMILKPGGKMIFTTPNYLSAWPLIEVCLNYFSQTNYSEQHITKFNWLNIEGKLRSIYPDFDRKFTVELKTTTHFLAPFLAFISFECSRKISRSVDHRKWRFPFGNLLMVVLIRKDNND